MKLLIVDDKYDVVQGIAEGVDWSLLGEITLFTAFSGKEALEIAEKNSVDLVITDIEMPGMSGIEMAEQIHERAPDTGIVFLSSHDSFRYAQSAIRIGCYDYILQPVDYETLRKSIAKVMEMMGRQKRVNPDSQAENAGERARDRSWRQLIAGTLPADQQGRYVLADEQGRAVSPDGVYRLALVHLIGLQGTLDVSSETDPAGAFEEYARKLFHANLALVRWISVSGDRWAAVFADGDLIPCFQLLVGEAENRQTYRVAAFLSGPCRLEEISSQYRGLEAMDRNNVAGYPGVYEYRPGEEAAQEQPENAETLSLHRWKGWLLEGNEERISEEIDQYLHRMEMRRELTGTTLILILQMLSSAFYNFDEDNMRVIMSSPQLTERYRRAADSREALMEYVGAIIEEHRNYRARAAEDTGQLLLRRIKSYIRSHLGNRLSREEISDVFYISRDYVSHLFGKYETRSFNQFVVECRIEKAKELLIRTSLPVSVVASSVGISEYTYFSKLFREHTGMSANEYRQQGRG